MPPVTVPPEYKIRVAVAVIPPDILEIYKDRPLKFGFVIWTSWFEPPAMDALVVVTVKSRPFAAASASGGAMEADALYGLLMSMKRGLFSLLKTALFVTGKHLFSL